MYSKTLNCEQHPLKTYRRRRQSPKISRQAGAQQSPHDSCPCFVIVSVVRVIPSRHSETPRQRKKALPLIPSGRNALIFLWVLRNLLGGDAPSAVGCVFVQRASLCVREACGAGKSTKFSQYTAQEGVPCHHLCRCLGVRPVYTWIAAAAAAATLVVEERRMEHRRLHAVGK